MAQKNEYVGIDLTEIFLFYQENIWCVHIRIATSMQP